jgi:hypothetical protein
MTAPEDPNRDDEQVAQLQPPPHDPFTDQAARLHRAGLDPDTIDEFRDRYAAWGEDQRGSFRNMLAGVSDRDLADEDGAPGPVLARFDTDEPPAVSPSGVVPAEDDEDRVGPGSDLTDASHPQPPTSDTTPPPPLIPPADQQTDGDDADDSGDDSGDQGGDGGGDATADAPPFDPTKYDQEETIAKLEALDSADQVEAVLAAERARTDRYAGGRRGVTAAAERIAAEKRTAQDG